MKQSTAQNITTVIFIVLMLFNLVVAFPITYDVDILKPYLSVYGVHLTIILTYYFTQDSVLNKSVTKFKFYLLLGMLLIWNLIILIITYSSRRAIDTLPENLTEFPEYAGFLIAAGIIWLFNGKNKSESKN